MIDDDLRSRGSLGLGFLIGSHIFISCLSLIFVSYFRFPNVYDPADFHILYQPLQLPSAVFTVAAFAPFAILLAFSRFSFGYFVGFYFYTMILGYLWLSRLTNLVYDHRPAELSAAVSAVAFLLPALFITSPIRQRFVLSATAFDRLLIFFVLLGVGTVIASASYNFHFVGIEDIYKFRGLVELPAILRYLIGITSSALLPFAFAGFAARRAYFRAAAVLVLLVFFYPIAFSKLALFTPVWLVAVWLLAKLAEARVAVVLSILVPVVSGLLLIGLLPAHAIQYFSVVNFRMIAIPSVAMDVYNDFFSRHDLTYFCQISVLKPLMDCPYQDLSKTMEEAYQLGAFNASLFATEGIASVGVLFAPVTAFACGLVFAVANRLSAGLPAGFILVSAAVIPPVLLNVPLTTVLLTHGAGILFLLWYVTPRSIFEAPTVPLPAPPTEAPAA
jgi:hypothetical protein